MVDLRAEPATEFVAVLMGTDVKPSFLARNIGNPLQVKSDGADPFPGSEAVEAALDNALWIQTWGSPGEPAGYRSPGKADGGRLTGRLVDPASSEFTVAAPPWASLLVYAKEPCTISGRIYVAPEA